MHIVLCYSKHLQKLLNSFQTINAAIVLKVAIKEKSYHATNRTKKYWRSALLDSDFVKSLNIVFTCSIENDRKKKFTMKEQKHFFMIITFRLIKFLAIQCKIFRSWVFKKIGRFICEASHTFHDFYSVFWFYKNRNDKIN